MDSKAFKNILNQAITLFAIFLIVNFVYNYFFNQPSTPKTGIQFFVDKQQYGQNELISAHLENYTDHPIILKNLCPQPDLQVETLQNGQWKPLESTLKLDCTGLTDTTIQPNEKHVYSFKHWNHLFFGELGTYRVKANIDNQSLESAQFQVVNISFLSWIYTILIYQPIYNALVFFTSIVPGHSLGWAIILLTILIRTILLIPNHKILKSQKKMQEIQPKISALKEKHGDDQQKIAQETFAIYKEHKVSPFGSCLPLLIQLPILIGLFNVIQTGMDPGSSYMLYPMLANFDLSQVQTVFLGLLDLTKTNIFVLPILVGIMQFFQLRLTMGKPIKDKKPASEMEAANRTMMYIMPVMMVFFTASVPSGVGLYWTFSTFYGLIQQIVVNRGSKKQETTIEVLNNKDKKEIYKEKTEQRKAAKNQNKQTSDHNDDDSGNNGKPPITIIKA